MTNQNRGAGQPRNYSRWEWARGYLSLIATSPIFLLCWALATFVRRLPGPVNTWLRDRHILYTETQPMDFRIPPDTSIPAYMERWWRIPRNAYLNMYWHIVLRSDDDRAHHCHPWWNFSLVLDGGYWEHRVKAGGVIERTWCPPGTMKFRWHGKIAHRLELERRGEIQDVDDPRNGWVELPVRTIFITGPVLRRWGFHDGERGWVDAYAWDEHCEKHGLTGMKMDGGSDGAISERNHQTKN